MHRGEQGRVLTAVGVLNVCSGKTPNVRSLYQTLNISEFGAKPFKQESTYLLEKYTAGIMEEGFKTVFRSSTRDIKQKIQIMKSRTQKHIFWKNSF